MKGFVIMLFVLATIFVADRRNRKYDCNYIFFIFYRRISFAYNMGSQKPVCVSVCIYPAALLCKGNGIAFRKKSIFQGNTRGHRKSER